MIITYVNLNFILLLIMMGTLFDYCLQHFCQCPLANRIHGIRREGEQVQVFLESNT